MGTELVPIDGTDIALLSAIKTADEEGRPTPTTRELAYVLRISNGAVGARLKRLANIGYVLSPKGGAHRAYRITDMGKTAIVGYIRPQRQEWPTWPPR